MPPAIASPHGRARCQLFSGLGIDDHLRPCSESLWVTMISLWLSPFRSAQMGETRSTTRCPGIAMLITTRSEGTVSSSVISVASSWSPAMPW
ncbi:MAG: hypothetical protein OSB75_12780 [Dehalococcoidia bacterium]|nr:hypothetical protein [Dehalococcoidia bacterium]